MKKILLLQKLVLIVFAVVLLQLLFSTGKNVPVVYGADPQILFIQVEYGYFTTLNRSVYGGSQCGDPSNGRGGFKGFFTPDKACETTYGIGSKAVKDLGNYLDYPGTRGYSIDVCGASFSQADFIGKECSVADPIAPKCVEKSGGTRIDITYSVSDLKPCASGETIFTYKINRSGFEMFKSASLSCGTVAQQEAELEKEAIADMAVGANDNVYINGKLICDISAHGVAAQTPSPSHTPPPPAPPCAKWKDGTPESGVCEEVATSLFQGSNSSGNISTDPGKFIIRILTIILGFAGGIALLLLISAGYKIILSKGKPEGIQQGREQLTAALVGLVFIIFSFVIFQFVIADILKIPGIK